jgi:cyanophycinase
VLIDQHFSERGRLGRLLAAIAEHPGYLGIGIDENTAIVIEGDCFHVIGSGEATVLDARGMTHTNLRVPDQENDLALFGVQLHSLPAGYGFDLANRRPVVPNEERAEKSGE